MTSDDRERRIHDYVDGRMTAAEREALEAEIARDPRLAEEVEEILALGATLRGLDAPLPAGFHERARARFVADAASRAARAGRTRTPWEAWGLAAAALVLGAILVPWSMFTGMGPSGRPALESVADRTPRGDVARGPRAPAVAEPEVDRSVGTADDDLAGGRRQAEVTDRADRAERRSMDEPFAPAPEATAGTAEAPLAKKAATDSFEEQESSEGPRANRLSPATESGAPAAAAPARAFARPARRPTAVAVPDGGVALDAAAADAPPVVLVDSATFAARASSGGWEGIADLDPDFAVEAVAIAPGPARCSTVVVVTGPDGVTIELAAGDDAACAVRIPAGAGPIRIRRIPGPRP